MGLTVLYIILSLYLGIVFLEFIICVSLLYNWDKVNVWDILNIAFISLFIVVVPIILWNVYKGLKD